MYEGLQMNWVDYAILATIGLSIVISLVRGFMKEAISLVIWFSALYIASQFYPELAAYLTQISDQTMRNGAAIAILFIATLVVGSLINYLVSQFVQATGLTGTDRILGAVFGALRGVLIVAAVLFFIDSFTPFAQQPAWQASQLIPEFGVIIEWFFEYMQSSSSFLQQAVNKG